MVCHCSEVPEQALSALPPGLHARSDLQLAIDHSTTLALPAAVALPTAPAARAGRSFLRTTGACKDFGVAKHKEIHSHKLDPPTGVSCLGVEKQRRKGSRPQKEVPPHHPGEEQPPVGLKDERRLEEMSVAKGDL